MRITREFDVVQVTFFPRLFPVNVYLVEEEDGLTLIDAGIPVSLKGILATAQSLGKPITKIILTHAHSDHIGALDRLTEALPQAEVFISRRDARLLTGDTSLLPGDLKPRYAAACLSPKRCAPSQTTCWMTVTRLVHWSPLPHQDIRRGICPSWIRAAACSSLATRTSCKAALPYPGRVRPLFPFPALATWNREAALASAKRLAELEPSVLAVGHGRMLRQPAAAMRAATADAQQRFILPGGNYEPPARAGIAALCSALPPSLLTATAFRR